MQEKMNQEIELKLRLAPEHVDALVQHLNTIATVKPRLRLNNQYFDTAKGALNTAGAALRIRHQTVLNNDDSLVQEAVIQTLKTRGQSASGLHTRQEWDWPLSRPELDMSRIENSDAMAYLTVSPADIVSQFRTDFVRRVWHWHADSEDTVIELVLDQGTVSSGERDHELLELELELLQGDAGHLIALAQQITQKLPMLLSDISKAERGYALTQGGEYQLSKQAHLSMLALNQPLAQTLISLINYELSNLQRLLEIGLWQHDAEALVQVPWVLNGIRQVLKAATKVIYRQRTVSLIETLQAVECLIALVLPLAGKVLYQQADETASLDDSNSELKNTTDELLNTTALGVYLIEIAQWVFELELVDAEACDS